MARFLSGGDVGSILGSPLRSLPRANLLPVIITAIVCANVIFMVLGGLAYLNLRLAASAAWPALWALICSAVLWPLKQWLVNGFLALQEADVGIIFIVTWTATAPFRAVAAFVGFIIERYQRVGRYLFAGILGKLRARGGVLKYVARLLQHLLCIRPASRPTPRPNISLHAPPITTKNGSASAGKHRRGFVSPGAESRQSVVTRKSVATFVADSVGSLSDVLISAFWAAPPASQQGDLEQVPLNGPSLHRGRADSTVLPDIDEAEDQNSPRTADRNMTPEKALWTLLLLGYVVFVTGRYFWPYWHTIAAVATTATLGWFALGSMVCCCTHRSVFLRLYGCATTMSRWRTTLTHAYTTSTALPIMLLRGVARAVTRVFGLGDSALTSARRGAFQCVGCCIHPLVAALLITSLIAGPMYGAARLSTAVTVEWRVAFQGVRWATSGAVNSSATWARTFVLSAESIGQYAAIVDNFVRHDALGDPDNTIRWIEQYVTNDTAMIRQGLALLQEYQRAMNTSAQTRLPAANGTFHPASFKAVCPVGVYYGGEMCEPVPMAEQSPEPAPEAFIVIPPACNLTEADLKFSLAASLWSRARGAAALLVHSGAARQQACLPAMLAAARLPAILEMALGVGNHTRWPVSFWNLSMTNVTQGAVRAASGHVWEVSSHLLATAGAAARFLGGAGWLMMSSAFSASASVVELTGSVLLFLNLLFYLLCAENLWLDTLLQAFLLPETRAVVRDTLLHTIQQVFATNIKICVYNSLFTLLAYWTLHLHVPLSTAIAVAIASILPIPAVYMLIPVPAAIELAFKHGVLQGWGPYGVVFACMFYVSHTLGCSYAQWYMFAGVKRGHPAVLGLSILAGISAFGLHGALLGPLLTCALVVAYELTAAAVSRFSGTHREDVSATPIGVALEHDHEHCSGTSATSTLESDRDGQDDCRDGAHPESRRAGDRTMRVKHRGSSPRQGSSFRGVKPGTTASRERAHRRISFSRLEQAHATPALSPSSYAMSLGAGMSPPPTIRRTFTPAGVRYFATTAARNALRQTGGYPKTRSDRLMSVAKQAAAMPLDAGDGNVTAGVEGHDEPCAKE